MYTLKLSFLRKLDGLNNQVARDEGLGPTPYLDNTSLKKQGQAERFGPDLGQSSSQKNVNFYSKR